MRKITCLGLLLALTALCQSQGPRNAALDSLDALIAKEVSSNGVGGVTGGDVPGYIAAAYFEPQRKLGILFFHNGSGDKLDDWKMVNLIVDAIAPTLPVVTTVNQ